MTDPSPAAAVPELLRAITLTQPWCGLMAAEIKLIENRTRPMIKRDHIGKRIALHASRTLDENVYLRIKEIAPELFYRRANDGGDFDTTEDEEWFRLSQITGAVIAVATLADIIDIGRDRALLPGFLDIEFAAAVKRGTVADRQRRWYFQRVGYVLRDVRVVRKPVECRGFQGFWTMTSADSARVLAQLEPAA